MLEFSFEDVVNVFYCGTAAKWHIPNTLLVVIKDDDTNRYADEMNTIDGCRGAGYLSTLLQKGSIWSSANRPYQFRYRVIFEKVFNSAATYNVIFDHDWVNENDPYRGGLSILQEIQRIEELVAFV